MAYTEIPESTTSEAATSSCVESGFEAHRRRSAPPAARVFARFAGFRRDVQTGRQADAPEGLLLLETLPDLTQHGHARLGPGDPKPAALGECRILDVVRNGGDRGAHRASAGAADVAIDARSSRESLGEIGASPT